MHRWIATGLFLALLAPLSARAADPLCDTPDVKASLARGGPTVVVVWPRNAAKGGGTVIVVWPRSTTQFRIPEEVDVQLADAEGCCGGTTVVIWPFAPASKAKAADCGARSVIAWPLGTPRQQKRSAGNGNTVVIWPRREKPLDNGIVVVWPTGSGRGAAVTWPVADKFPARCGDGRIAVDGMCADGNGSTIIVWP